MVWFKVDDGFWSHPKVLELSSDALALWVRAGSYCASQLTDGKVSRAALRMLGERDAAVELVLAGLWDEDDDGFVFHDWAEYQPTREQVLAERAAAAERKRQSRARAREKSRGVSRRDSYGTDAVIPASPTRPDPTRPDLPSTTPNGLVEGETRAGALTPFCPKHPNGTDRACRACGNARLAFEAARAAERAKPTPLPRRPPECELHPGWPLPCDKCKQIAAEEAAKGVA